MKRAFEQRVKTARLKRNARARARVPERACQSARAGARVPERSFRARVPMLARQSVRAPERSAFGLHGLFARPPCLAFRKHQKGALISRARRFVVLLVRARRVSTRTTLLMRSSSLLEKRKAFSGDASPRGPRPSPNSPFPFSPQLAADARAEAAHIFNSPPSSVGRAQGP